MLAASPESQLEIRKTTRRADLNARGYPIDDCRIHLQKESGFTCESNCGINNRAMEHEAPGHVQLSSMVIGTCSVGSFARAQTCGVHMGKAVAGCVCARNKACQRY